MKFPTERNIIEEGYKSLLKKNHPDTFEPPVRPSQEEICKNLAAAKNRLIEAVNAWEKGAPMNAAEAVRMIRDFPMGRPIIDEKGAQVIAEGFSDLLKDLLGIKRPRRARRPPGRA